MATTIDLDGRRAEMYPERRMSMEKIINSLPTCPVDDPFATNLVEQCMSDVADRLPVTTATQSTPPGWVGCAQAIRAPNSSFPCSKKAPASP